MNRLRFLWVDDQKGKVESYRDVIAAGSDFYRATIELLEVKSTLLDELKEWCSENRNKPPHLIIIDHVFNPTLPFGIKGSSVAHLLRNELNRVPMVCVTSMYDRPRSFDQEDISEYTALFLYQRLEHHIEDLYAIARDFPKLHPSGRSLRSHIVSCLKPPVRDREDLLRVLPEEFQDDTHATTDHRVAKWIFGTLLKRPGFLYDRLHTATLLGLTEAGLAKVEGLFEKAKYKGVFATARDSKWWSSAVSSILYGIVGTFGPDLPQHAGRSLPGITPDDYSTCYVTKKKDPPPDAVVRADATGDTKRRVVRRQYADLHPNHPSTTAGFESWLILRRASK